MNLKTKLAASVLLAASTSMAQASTISVVGSFDEPMTAWATVFKGTFDWNGTNVSNFSGLMNVSMQGDWTDVPGHTYQSYGPYTAYGKKTDQLPAQNTFWAQLNDLRAKGLYMLDLNKNLIETDDGTTHTATIFRLNNSDVYQGGGYVGQANGYKYGYLDGNTPNENSFFTVSFTHDAAGNITSLGTQTWQTNPNLVNKMAYGDCSIGSLMGSGTGCMAGEPTGTVSMMNGTPGSQTLTDITPASVPVPGAVWLFGSALMGLLGVNRRKSVFA